MESGVLVLPDVHITVSDLVKVCWMISDDWLSCVELGDELVRYVHIQQGVHRPRQDCVAPRQFR